jgi:MerR family transcriptional regulator/heat shock protein HspR
MRVERKKPVINQGNGAASTQATHDEQRPVYFISVVAEMVETHPQTLRMYERMGLVAPCRTPAGVRLYSQADVEQVRRIQHLTQQLGVNLAGVEVIFDLLREMQRLQAEMEVMLDAQNAARASRKSRNSHV